MNLALSGDSPQAPGQPKLDVECCMEQLLSQAGTHPGLLYGALFLLVMVEGEMTLVSASVLASRGLL